MTKLHSPYACAVVLVLALALGACMSDDDGEGNGGSSGQGAAGQAATSAGGQAGNAGAPLAGDGAGDDASMPFDDERPECIDGNHLLAEHFNLQREVDYLADRRGAQVLSEVGERCAGARDRALCEQAIASNALAATRHLLTTEGDKILQWDGGSVINLFGVIDTIAEAIWLSESADYEVNCDTQVSLAEDLFIVRDATAHWGCAEPQAIVTIVVTPEGGVSEVRQQGLNAQLCSPKEVPGGFAGMPVPPSVPIN